MDPDASAERLLRGALLELQEAEHIRRQLEAATPHPGRAARLAVIRDTIAQLLKVVDSPRTE